MKKLFFALWPDDAIRQQCSNVIEKISSENIYPVAEKNIHATLLFLGRISPEQEAAIIAAVAILPIPSISLSFDQLSFWKKPAVLCLTSRHFDRELVSLSDQLAAIAKQYAVPIDERSFKPHITLARKAKEAVLVEFTPILWQSQAFCLVESCSLADGVEYRVLKRWTGI